MRSIVFKRIFFLLIFFASFFCGKIIAQQALTTLQKSSSPNMMMMSNSSRYASYQHFSYWIGLYGDSLKILNPYWLGSILPSQNVTIATEKHNLIFTNGNIFSWATDTTGGNWIMQGYLDPSLSGGVGQWGARNYLTGKRYGINFNGATGTTLFGYPALYLANEQIQDSILNDAYTYVPTVQAGNTRTGAIDYVRIDSLNTTWLKPELEAGNNVDINSTTQTTMSLDSVQVFVGEAQDSIYINRRGASTFGTTNLLDMQGYFNSNLTSRYIFSDPGYFYMQNWGNTVSEAPRQYFGSARGTKSSPSALQNGDNIGITFYQDIADAPALLNTAKYAVIVKKDTTYNGLPTGVMWFNPGENDISTSTLIASPYTRMVINRTGVGIGAPIYPKARLHLNGTFRAEGLGTSTSTTELLGRDANKDVFPISIGSGLSLTSGTLKTNAAFCNTAVNEATNLGIGVASVNLNTTSNFNGDPTTYTVGASSIQLLNAGVYTLTVQFSANFSAGDELTIAPTLTGGSVGSTIQTLSFAVPTAANYGNTFTFPIRVITAPTTLTVAISRTATIAAESVNATISLNKNY